jgi:hypothetical protein
MDQVIHVMFDSGAAEEMGLRRKALGDKASTFEPACAPAIVRS